MTDGVEFGSWIRESKDSFRDSLSGILPTGILSTGFDFGDSLEDSFLGFFFRDSFSGILSQGCFEGFFDIQILSMDSSRDTSRDSSRDSSRRYFRWRPLPNAGEIGRSSRIA